MDFEKEPKYSLRKLAIGLVSVMFGTIIFAVSNTSVQAATNQSNDKTIVLEKGEAVGTDTETKKDSTVEVEKPKSASEPTDKMESKAGETKEGVEPNKSPEASTAKTEINEVKPAEAKIKTQTETQPADQTTKNDAFQLQILPEEPAKGRPPSALSGPGRISE